MNIIDIPLGTAFLKMLKANPPETFSLFGWNDNKSAEIPIVANSQINMFFVVNG